MVIFRLILLISAILLANSCSEIEENNQDKITKPLNPDSIPEAKKVLTIEQVEKMMEEASLAAEPGPNFDKAVANLDYNSGFERTPTGAYLSQLVANSDRPDRIREGSKQVAAFLYKSKECKTGCSKSFKNDWKNNRNNIEKRLEDVSRDFIVNELININDYIVFYHAFPNDFRLYQDVLRVIKSFEQLNNLNTTYPFRELAYNDSHLSIENFLKGWWDAYLEHVKKNNVSPFPSKSKSFKAPGKSVGLTFYPDSITYAQTYLLSANLSFLGNTMSAMNSTVFFFLNSSSATGLNIVDWLIEKSLTPYLLKNDGSLDQPKLEKTITELKNIFSKSLASSGGQVAQIFIKKSVAPELAFLAFNGGEPVWFSKTTNKSVFKENKYKPDNTMPLNIFWPIKDDDKRDLYLPNIVDIFDRYTGQYNDLLEVFPYNKGRARQLASTITGTNDPAKKDTKLFVASDLAQARLLASPKYFTNPSLTGVKIVSFKATPPQELADYNRDIYDLIRGIMSDFLSRASKEKDFKAGEYPLKNVFINLSKPN